MNNDSYGQTAATSVVFRLAVALCFAGTFLIIISCGGTAATGPPVFRYAWEASREQVAIDESFTLSIRMYDVTEAREHGGLSVSFPTLVERTDIDEAYSSAAGDVEVESYTTGLSRVDMYGMGSTIYHRDDNRMFPAQYLLVESDDASWAPSDDRTLRLRITPRVSGEFPVLIRSWACADAYTGCVRHPVSGPVTDQQGYAVDVLTINVQGNE